MEHGARRCALGGWQIPADELDGPAEVDEGSMLHVGRHVEVKTYWLSERVDRFGRVTRARARARS